MIPKIIHYCWFGRKPKPAEVLHYIETWKKYCPEYIIKEWNESNFDITINPYCREAYHAGKWAFVSDVVRMYALYNEGGIYMDTDVEVVRSLDNLLHHQAFLGFEGTQWIATSIIGTEKGNPIIGRFLESYSYRPFLKKDGTMDLTTNVERWTQLLVSEYGLVLDGKQQEIGNFTIYPFDFFTPYDYVNGKIIKTENTYTIHWFKQSWIGQKKWRTKVAQWFHRVTGIKME